MNKKLTHVPEDLTDNINRLNIGVCGASGRVGKCIIKNIIENDEYVERL